MTHLDLFSGIGGFALAASWVWEDHDPTFCERDEYCQRVLRKHWPEAVIHGDITTLDATGYRGAVDLITGGFPCQPYSVAGKQRGSEDDRALWPEMLRIVDECRPRWVVGENVGGFVTMAEYDSEPPVDAEGSALGEIGDLYHRVGRGVAKKEVEALKEKGYEVEVVVVPACSVEANQERYRAWIIGYDESVRRDDPQAPEGRRQSTGTAGGSDSAGAVPGVDERGGESVCSTGAAIGPAPESDSGTLAGTTPGDHGKRRGEFYAPSFAAGTKFDYRVCDEGGGSGVYESRVVRVVHGVPGGMDRPRIHALGNAIVPQVAAEIFRCMKAINEGAV